MIAAKWYNRFNQWRCAKYVYFVFIVILLIEVQIWLTQGQASVSEERRTELDLPSIWICPRTMDFDVSLKRCEFEQRGDVKTCSTMGRVKYEYVGGKLGVKCALVTNVDGSAMVVRTSFRLSFFHTPIHTHTYIGSEYDKLLLEIELNSRSPSSEFVDKEDGGGGVVVVIGRDKLLGNQWFFAKKGDFTAVLLSRTERYEYTSPVGSEVYHDYNIYTSGMKLSPSNNAIHTWPPHNQMKIGGGEHDIEGNVDVENRIALQVMYRSMLIKISKVAFKYPPIADFARVFGPIGGIIGLYKAVQDYRKRRKRNRSRSGASDIGIGLLPVTTSTTTVRSTKQ